MLMSIHPPSTQTISSSPTSANQPIQAFPREVNQDDVVEVNIPNSTTTHPGGNKSSSAFPATTSSPGRHGSPHHSPFGSPYHSPPISPYGSPHQSPNRYSNGMTPPSRDHFSPSPQDSRRSSSHIAEGDTVESNKSNNYPHRSEEQPHIASPATLTHNLSSITSYAHSTPPQHPDGGVAVRARSNSNGTDQRSSRSSSISSSSSQQPPCRKSSGVDSHSHHHKASAPRASDGSEEIAPTWSGSVEAYVANTPPIMTGNPTSCEQPQLVVSAGSPTEPSATRELPAIRPIVYSPCTPRERFGSSILTPDLTSKNVFTVHKAFLHHRAVSGTGGSGVHVSSAMELVRMKSKDRQREFQKRAVESEMQHIREKILEYETFTCTLHGTTPKVREAALAMLMGEARLYQNKEKRQREEAKLRGTANGNSSLTNQRAPGVNSRVRSLSGTAKHKFFDLLVNDNFLKLRNDCHLLMEQTCNLYGDANAENGGAKTLASNLGAGCAPPPTPAEVLAATRSGSRCSTPAPRSPSSSASTASSSNGSRRGSAPVPTGRGGVASPPPTATDGFLLSVLDDGSEVLLPKLREDNYHFVQDQLHKLMLWHERRPKM